MLCSNVVDQFLDQHGFSYTGSSKQSDFSTFLIRAEQIDNFNSCL